MCVSLSLSLTCTKYRKSFGSCGRQSDQSGDSALMARRCAWPEIKTEVIGASFAEGGLQLPQPEEIWAIFAEDSLHFSSDGSAERGQAGVARGVAP